MWRRPSRQKSVPLPVLAELRDIDSPTAARRAGVEFGREACFAADLRRVRPWLPAHLPGRDLPAALLDSEWIGFLALLDERGPWVYVQNVRELQDLTRLYSLLFQAASTDKGGLAGASLLARLGAAPTPELEALEAEFWRQAAGLAQHRHQQWALVRREMNRENGA